MDTVRQKLDRMKLKMFKKLGESSIYQTELEDSDDPDSWAYVTWAVAEELARKTIAFDPKTEKLLVKDAYYYIVPEGNSE